MLQPADFEIDAVTAFATFDTLCVKTKGDLGLVEEAAAAAGFEPFDFRLPMRPDVLKLKRQIAFRQPGFFLTAQQFTSRERKMPTTALNVSSLLVRPASFAAVRNLFVSEFGEPNQRDLSGVGISFVSIAGSNVRPESYDDGHRRHVESEGDLLVVQLNDVRTIADVPSETISMSYSHWMQ